MPALRLPSRKNPMMTSVSYADCVVEAPYGAHPYAAHGNYMEDREGIKAYVDASNANRKGETKVWEDYLKRTIHDPADHVAYLETVGMRTLLGLYQHPLVTW